MPSPDSKSSLEEARPIGFREGLKLAILPSALAVSVGLMFGHEYLPEFDTVNEIRATVAQSDVMRFYRAAVSDLIDG